ncbi:MAG: nucleotidyltransferase domain-containing protein [Bacillota bacterium]
MSKTDTLASEAIRQAVDLLREQLAAELVYLFGSAARGELRPESDLDFAFWSERRFVDYEVFMVAQQLADQLRREVDLIDLRKASTVLKAQIVGYGRNIYAVHANRRINFEIVALKEYALLNEERQVVIDSFIKGVSPGGK